MNLDETQIHYYGNEEQENLINIGGEDYYVLVHRQTGQIQIYNQEWGIGGVGDRLVGTIDYNSSTNSYGAVQFNDENGFRTWLNARGSEIDTFTRPTMVYQIINHARNLATKQNIEEGEITQDVYPQITEILPDVFTNYGPDKTYIQYGGLVRQLFTDNRGETYIKLPELVGPDNIDGKFYIDVSKEPDFIITDPNITNEEPRNVEGLEVGSDEIGARSAEDILQDIGIQPGSGLCDRLTKKQINQYTQLIEDNPPDRDSQEIIGALLKACPDTFGKVKQRTSEDLSHLSFEEQWAHWQRIEAAKRDSRRDVQADSTTSGWEILLADPCLDGFFTNMENTLTNFVKKLSTNKLVGNIAAIAGGLGGGISFGAELKTTAGLIGDISKRLVGKMAGALEDSLVKFIKMGLGGMTQFFYNTITNPIKALAKATGFQTDALNPIGSLFNAMGCVVSKVTDALYSTVEDMLTKMVSSVINPAVCVVDEFISGIINRVTGLMDTMIGPFILPIEKLFAPVGLLFGLPGVLRKGVSMINKALNIFRCGKGQAVECPTSSKFKIDMGIVKTLEDNANNSKVAKLFDKAADVAKTAAMLPFAPLAGIGITSTDDFEDKVGNLSIFGSKVGDAKQMKCDTNIPINCGYPEVEFFGGKGEGGAGKVILGNFINHFNKDNILGDIKQTASVIGVDITYPGEGYEEAPWVVFKDKCDQGYGAYGRAIIDQNVNSSTYGQITDVVMITEGENYPTGDIEEAYVDKIIIQDGGRGYEEGDTIDDFEICGIDSNGSITCVQPNEKAYTLLPPMKINSNTGSGAILRPVMSTTRRQTAVEQQIDCVTT